MFYLPRICEHCLNPSCVASCPSGAMYKRSEDGIVLVDQDRCRGWRMCVSGCPYKKVYFSHKTGKAEKRTPRYPRMEVGLPTICSETCVAAALLGPGPLRRRSGVEGGVGGKRHRPIRGAAPNPVGRMRPRGDHRRTRGGDLRRVDRRRAALAGVCAHQPATRWRCRCIRNTAPCRWSGTSRRCRRWSTRSAATVTTARNSGNLSVRWTHCVSRCSTWPNCSPPGDTAVVEGGAAAAGRDAFVHARYQSRAGDPAAHSALGRDDRRSRSTRCTGCWPSRNTKSATSFQPRSARRPAIWSRWAARQPVTAGRA